MPDAGGVQLRTNGRPEADDRAAAHRRGRWSSRHDRRRVVSIAAIAPAESQPFTPLFVWRHSCVLQCRRAEPTRSRPSVFTSAIGGTTISCRSRFGRYVTQARQDIGARSRPMRTGSAGGVCSHGNPGHANPGGHRVDRGRRHRRDGNAGHGERRTVGSGVRRCADRAIDLQERDRRRGAQRHGPRSASEAARRTESRKIQRLRGRHPAGHRLLRDQRRAARPGAAPRHQRQHGAEAGLRAEGGVRLRRCPARR